MRARLSVLALLGILVVAAGVGLRGGTAAPNLPVQPVQRGGPVEVDVELVLAVDVSYSMDPDELALQRDGYTSALTSPEFLKAVRGGIHGQVAVTYVEWAGMQHREVIVPWRLIDGPESADAFAADIARAPYNRASRTSISGAMLIGAELIKSSGYRGMRRVIDVSGDGVNNNGPPVDVTRDQVLAQGITINGLPILLRRPNIAWMDIGELDVYYEDCVIGGPGAFVIPIRNREQFKEATRTKLVLEIAGRMPPQPRVIPVQGIPGQGMPGPFVPGQTKKEPRVSCSIGEQLWQRRWGN